MPGGPDREFFMRKCYETFYRLITDRMETESRYVTVTGSHGVGKSVFMQYFCQRFRNENPTVTIICVAFDDCSRVQESRVIYPASLPQLMNPTVPIIAGNVLYVYDGPPPHEPAAQKMIVFCGPYQDWLCRAEASEKHTLLYFPPWVLDELLAARHALSLKLSSHEIERRFNVFGGSARVCLCHSDEFVERARIILGRAIQNITSVTHLRRCLSNNEALGQVPHPLFHIKPDGGNFTRCKISFASPYIEALSEKHIKRTLDDTRLELLRVVRGLREFGGFSGHLFEQLCNQRFWDGSEYRIVSLTGRPRSRMISIPTGAYIETQLNCESVDGVMVDKDDHGTTVIWLFQMTVAARHPINSKGIEKLVADLVDQGGRGKPERPRHIKLIFVVPADAEKFKAQKIRVIPAGSEVKQLARLDTFTKPDLSKLRGRSIETVADLIAEMDKDPDLERFRHLLPTDCIEQFVLRMPDS